MGIRPSEPHTGYGYIAYRPEDKAEFKTVEKFVEKPPLEKAKAYLDAGNYLWNAGIFVWKASTLRDAYRRHLPAMYRQMENVPYNTPQEAEIIASIFPRLENISVDYGIMEKAANVAVLPVDFRWNDLGSWDAIYRQLKTREGENIITGGRLYTKNARGNLVKTGGKKVIISGLEDYLIIDSGDVLMIIPRHEAQEVKEWRKKIEGGA